MKQRGVLSGALHYWGSDIVEILIGLAIATAIVYGWFRGLVLVAIFLSVSDAFLMFICGLAKTGDPALVLVGVTLLAIAWAPLMVRRHYWIIEEYWRALMRPNYQVTLARRDEPFR